MFPAGFSVWTRSPGLGLAPRRSIGLPKRAHMHYRVGRSAVVAPQARDSLTRAHAVPSGPGSSTTTAVVSAWPLYCLTLACAGPCAHGHTWPVATGTWSYLHSPVSSVAMVTGPAPSI